MIICSLLACETTSNERTSSCFAARKKMCLLDDSCTLGEYATIVNDDGTTKTVKMALNTKSTVYKDSAVYSESKKESEAICGK